MTLTVNNAAPGIRVTPAGTRGPSGPANTLSISDVTTLAPGASATVSVTGVAPIQALSFGIPRGAKVLSGTGAPGSPASLQALDGDLYLRTSNGDLHQVSAGNWVLRVTLMGPAGQNSELRFVSPDRVEHRVGSGDWSLLFTIPNLTAFETIRNDTVTARDAALAAEVAAEAARDTAQGVAASLSPGQPNGIATLDGGGKVPVAQLPDAVVGALKFQGTWNATTNTPTIPTAAAGNRGHYYVVATAGSTSVGGVTDWQIGDWLVSDGSSWSKIDNTEAVASVAGLTGVISAASLRSALALVIGTDVQAHSSALTTLATQSLADSASLAANTADRILTAASVWGSVNAPTALSDAATIAIDMATGINFSVTLAGNRTLGAPANTKPGQAGVIIVNQDVTGGRTLSYNAVYKFAGGAAVSIDTTGSRRSILSYFVIDSSNIVLTALAGVR